ncbi:branched-chain amino acid ABC transporter permease [Pseudodonghicola flavimaris]|uniref:Branched-chain amino acid ABC transporter permease n=1 Tax=Pseudodonghicola flavimaris TaxID=3050036 RepID=A0ABT7F575_9RHOB|nr:branched-chain amino acid ABC transporter permease [Pseudodonghicola flavimaris]MDK3019755.1 branched-chain amino acid ABC transporter permease [Pseudodonghicola flavimaris]
MELVNTISQGVLLGGLFALYALGLSLVFGVMRIVNIAHGDLIVVLAYIGLTVTEFLGVSVIVAAPLILVVAGGLGWVLQRGLFEFVPRHDPLIPLLVAFGLSIILQNLLLMGYGADPQKLSLGRLEQASVEILPNLHIGVFSLIIFGLAVAMIGGLQLMIYRTGFGRALRAVSDNEANAAMLGLDTRAIFRKAFVIVMLTVAVAALLMAIRGNFDPASGSTRLLTAFEAIVIGGLGSMWGTLAGGVIIGIAQMVGAQIDASWQVLAGHLVFLVLLFLRPSGLFPKNDG